MADAFSTPPDNRFFEDYAEGATYICGSVTVSEDDIVRFAAAYDPQAMHVDRLLAAKGRGHRQRLAYGGADHAPFRGELPAA
jgi:acyl dehydratase